MCLSITAILGTIDGYNNNRCDSDISFFDTFCIFDGQVNFSLFLIKFSSHSCSPSHLGEPDSLDVQNSNRLVSHTKDSSVVPIPSNRLEVTVHMAYHEECPMSQTNHSGSYPISDAKSTKKPHELASDDNVEGGDEKL